MSVWSILHPNHSSNDTKQVGMGRRGGAESPAISSGATIVFDLEKLPDRLEGSF